MITLLDISKQKYAVLGLGKSGMATAVTLQASKADFFVWDDDAKTRAQAEKAGYRVMEPASIDVTGYRGLVLSPGIPHKYPEPHPVVQHFRSAGVPILSDIDLLFRACPLATYVGITGTNGKSTTTALIGHILNRSYRKVQVGGNLGFPVLSFQPMGADAYGVLELSAYQLELMHQNRLRVAVLLNITSEHLDRHTSLEGYTAAKRRIISDGAPQTLVIGVDEPETKAIVQDVRSCRYLQIEEISVLQAVRSGVEVAGSIMVAHRLTGSKNIIDLSTLSALPGKHNWQNACAAFAACRALGLSFELIEHGLKTFPGLAHRQQLIATLGGVRFINDSKATNALSVSKALTCYKNIYWIVGGRPKENGLVGLEPYMSHVEHAFLFGEAEDKFADWCDGKVSFTRCGTMARATEQAAAMAWKQARAGAVVLLSPACTAFDQFANFEDRGEQFVLLVKDLHQSHPAKSGS